MADPTPPLSSDIAARAHDLPPGAGMPKASVPGTPRTPAAPPTMPTPGPLVVTPAPPFVVPAGVRPGWIPPGYSGTHPPTPAQAAALAAAPAPPTPAP